MEFPVMGLIRVAAIAGLGLGLVAVGLGRMNPATGGSRTPAPVDHVGIGGPLQGESDGGTQLLDLESGQLKRLLRPGDELIDHLSFSPWRDDRGQAQLVGRQIRFGAESAAREFGLVRLTYPGGVELDRVATEILPNSAPCWYPGTAPRILFSAGDGSLYHFAFADPGGRGRGRSGDAGPRALTWRRAPERLADSRILDPIWPADPALKGLILVSMNVRGEAAGGRYDGAKLWWLRLNEVGTEILAAGRLTRPDPDQGPDSDVDERLPAVSRQTPEGALLLTYLARSRGESRWRVRMAPVQIEEGTGLPAVDVARGRILAEACDTLIPTLSLDGRWVACLRSQESGAATLVRIPLEAPARQPAR